MIKLYVIQKADKPNHYIRVVNNVPSVVTDVRKATVFQRNEAEKFMLLILQMNMGVNLQMKLEINLQYNIKEVIIYGYNR